MTRLQALARGLVSLAGLAVTLVGVPWALARYGRWPVAGVPGDDWWQRLSDSAVSDTTVFGVLTVAAWLVWAVFAASVLVELAAGLRGVHAPRLAVAGPLQRGARGLVVGVLLMVSVLHQSGASIVAAAPTSSSSGGVLPVARAAVTVVLDDYQSTRSDVGPTSGSAEVASPAGQVALPAPGGTVEVRDGDNPWDLAATHLGDGMRWTELWELNRGIPQPDGRAWTDPDVIGPGWVLVLPGHATPALAEQVATAGPAVTVVVVDGDTLSGIAQQHLGDQDRWREVFEANRDVDQPDGRRLTDPNLIVPGWQLTIPASEQPDPPAPDTTVVDTVNVEVEVVVDDPLPAGPVEDAAPTPTPPPAPAVVSTPATTTPPPTPAKPPVATPRVESAVPATTASAPSLERVPGDSADGASDVVTMVAGIGSALVLATGLTLRSRRLRRRRATRGVRHGATPPTLIEQAVLTAADVPIVRWAGQRLALLVRELHPRIVTAAPLAVELSAEAGIEVLWDQAQQAPPPAGWVATDGGAAWRLGFDPDEPIPSDGLSAAIPALVTLGVRDGRQLLVDLEAVGVLTVVGPNEAAAALLRSITVELAGGDNLSDAYVTAVDLPGVDRLDLGARLAVGNAADAGATLRSNAGSIRAVLEHARLDGTFLGRVASEVPIEATVVVAHRLDVNELATLTAGASRRSGVALVATASAADAESGARVVLDPDAGTARLEPFGIEFVPAGLPVESVEVISDTLAELATLPDEPEPSEADVFNHAISEQVTLPENGEGDGVPPNATPALLLPWPGNGYPEPNGHPANGTARNGIGSEGTAEPPEVEPEVQPAVDASPERPGGGQLDPARFGLVPAGESMLVRVLGVPAIPVRPHIGRRELIVTTLLACRSGSVAASAAQDAVWPGKAIELKTAWNLYGKTRTALGRIGDDELVMPAAERARGLLHLSRRVTTDLALLHAIVNEAPQRSTAEAIGLLRDGLALVHGPPFDADGYDWAFVSQEVAQANALIERAVAMLVELAVDAGTLDVAREAITQGLRGLPGDEGLYRRRMRVEALVGNQAGVVAAWDELRAHLTEFDAEPSTATADLYRELVGSRPGTARLS